jgi:hypothetical protein
MRVTLNSQQIQAFKNTWPCNGIPELSQITFEFSSNGDLVDIDAYQDSKYVDSAEFDGPALLALSHDAQKGAR